MHDVSIFTQRSNQEQQHVPSTGMGIRGRVVRIQGKHAGEFEFRNEHSVRTGRGKSRAATSYDRKKVLEQLERYREEKMQREI